jgi:HD-GYP domain-containing protein (c-di-GMP phosphodiesterase class II)
VGLALPRRLLPGRHVPDDSEMVVRALVEAVNQHDTYSGGHSYRVAQYAANVARLMGLPDDEISFIRQGALVHDIGKIGIPEPVLKKAGKLNAEELHLVRLHPIFGASILSRLDGTKTLIPMALHHHERWDGDGYPSGLTQVDIPMEARIVSVADAFDAMTTGRPHGAVLSTSEALAELRRSAGTQFDPLLVDVMHEAERQGFLESAQGDRPLANLVL